MQQVVSPPAGEFVYKLTLVNSHPALAGQSNPMPFTTRLASTKPRRRDDDGVVSRYHDTQLAAEVVSIVVGGCAVSDDPRVMITTTVGSCVATCIFDPVARVGGMNHFLLPDSGDDRLSAASRYGSAAMEQLINRLLAITGRRDRLRSKVFGGANIVSLRNSIGKRNIDFVMTYLTTEGIPTIGWDVGGSQGRAVRFFPATGRSQRRLIGIEQDCQITRSESRYLDRLRSAEIEGGIELF